MQKIVHRFSLRLLLLAIVLLLGTTLRIVESLSLPFWMDEAYSFWFTQLGWSYLWTELPKFENHPSAYFLLLKGWREIAGSSEFALRLPSVLASLGSVLALFFAGRIMGETLTTEHRERGGWIMGLTAAALAAFSQFEITYAGEARAYAFASLGTSLMLVGVLRIMAGTPARPDGTRSPAAAAALVLGMSISLWAHSLGLVPAGLVGLFLIGWWAIRRRWDGAAFLRLALMAGAVVLLCWPHFVNTLDQLSRDYSSFWIEAPSVYKLAVITFKAAGLPGVPFGVPMEALVTAIVMSAGLIGLFRLGGRTAPAAAVLPVFLAGGYWLICVAYTYLSQPVLLDRTLIYIHPPAVLIAAAAPWALGRHRRILSTGLACLALMASIGPNDLHPGGQRLYAAAARQIAERNLDAPVIALPWTAEVLLSYYETRLDVDFDIRTIPEPFPPRKNGVPDLISPPDVSSEDIIRVVDQVGDVPVLWVLARKSRQEAAFLRKTLRDAGWTESAIFEPRRGNETTFLRYEIPTAAIADIGD